MRTRYRRLIFVREKCGLFCLKKEKIRKTTKNAARKKLQVHQSTFALWARKDRSFFTILILPAKRLPSREMRKVNSSHFYGIRNRNRVYDYRASVFRAMIYVLRATDGGPDGRECVTR